MASNTKSKPTNFIASGVQEAKKNYLKGARDTNESYASIAGSELRKGNGTIMTQYNRNRHNIEQAESEI